MPETLPSVVIRPILSETKAWFDKARPHDTLSTKDFRSQLGCHFEEIAEMCFSISTDVQSETYRLLKAAYVANHELAEHLKTSNNQVAWIEEENAVEFLDAICDQIVTGVGVGHTCHADVVGALNEVNRSNFSKFDADGNPIYDANRKVTKGPNYSKADLTPFV